MRGPRSAPAPTSSTAARPSNSRQERRRKSSPESWRRRRSWPTPTSATLRSTSTASSACSTSSSACWTRLATRTTPSSSGSSSSASSARSSASSSWCASPACGSRSRPVSREPAADGYTPQQLLPLAQPRALGLMKAARQCFSELRPELEAAGIHIVDHADLDAGQRATLRRYYEDRVFPVLTPLAFDPGRPFPHISNMSHNLGVLLRDANGDERFARVKVPDSLPRLVPVVAAGEGRGERRTASSSSGSPGSSRSSPPTSRRCSPAWRCWSRTRSGSRATPSWPSRNSRRTTSSRRSSSSSAGAASAPSSA